MSDPKFQTVELQGTLLKKADVSGGEAVRLTLQTRSGRRIVTAHNPLITDKLETGTEYLIKGDKRHESGRKYIRIMSARAVVQKPLLSLSRRGFAGGGVALLVVAGITAFAAAPLALPLSQTTGDETKTRIDAAEASDATLPSLNGSTPGTRTKYSEQAVPEPSAQSGGQPATQSTETTAQSAEAPETAAPDTASTSAQPADQPAEVTDQPAAATTPDSSAQTTRQSNQSGRR